MRIDEIRGCCVADIVHGFGQSSIDISNLCGTHSPSKDQIMRFIQERIPILKKRGQAMLIAITNHEQTRASLALEELGFSYSGWMSKNHHSETQVCLWWLPIYKEDKC